MVIFNFTSLLIYFILRPPRTLAELYEESLEEEAVLQGIYVQASCPVCRQRAEQDFIFCPWCQTRLKRLCIRCDRPLLLRWKACPSCGEAATGPLIDEKTPTALTSPGLERGCTNQISSARVARIR